MVIRYYVSKDKVIFMFSTDTNKYQLVDGVTHSHHGMQLLGDLTEQ